MTLSLTRALIFSKLHVHTTATFYSLTKPIPITTSRSFFFATNKEDKKDTKREPTEKELKEVVGFLAWAKTPESLASMEATAERYRNNGVKIREMREMMKKAKIDMEAIIKESDATKRNAMEVVEKRRNNVLQIRVMREMMKKAKIDMEAIIEQTDATKRNAMEVLEKLRAIRDGGHSAGSP